MGRHRRLYLVYLRKRPHLHKESLQVPGGAVGAWVVLAFMKAMGVILAWDTRALASSIPWCGLRSSWARPSQFLIPCCVVRRAASWATVVRAGPHQGRLHEVA